MSDDIQIEQVKIDNLIPYINNSRSHSPIQIAQVAASIKNDWRFYPLNDCYAADVDGNIYSVCRRQRTKSGGIAEKYETKLLNGSIDKYGYKTYRIFVDGKKRHIKGHRIVMAAFVGDSEKPCVNHIDGIKQNNRLENLEYVTVAENNKHAIKTGLWNKHMAKPKRKILHSDYVSIYILNKVVGYSRKELARMNNVSRQTIGGIIRKIDPILSGVTNVQL